MTMKLEYEGEKYVFDMEQDCSTDQLIKIKKTYGLNLATLAQGQREGDIEALICTWWLIQQANGKDLLRLETVTLANPVSFAAAIMVALVQEQEEFFEAAKKAIEEAEAKAKAEGKPVPAPKD